MKQHQKQSGTGNVYGPGRGKRRGRAAEVLMAALEPRVLYTGVTTDPTIQQPDMDMPAVFDQAATQETVDAQVAAGPTKVPVSGAVPILHSRPGATAKLIIDFDGDGAYTWGSYNVPATPAYDQDGDATTFTTAELASINEIWQRVAEKYSPFNIDVTTQDTGNYANKVAVKVVVGGSGGWLGSVTGGIAYIGGFYNSADNKAYVFPGNLANGYAKYVGEAVSHEAGHTFGLQHQGTFNGTTLVQEYNEGDTYRAPIMGDSYYAQRGLWWSGTPSNNSSGTQSDLSIISNASNGFGYRVDDYGSSIGAATGLTLSNNTFSVGGVIEQTTDADYFQISVGSGGTLALNLTVAQYGAMLDGSLFVYNGSGTLVASADTSGLGETLSLDVPAGTYYVDVTSHGGYGDIGQYTLSGTFAPGAQDPGSLVVVADPTGLNATAVSAGEVDLTWVDNSDNEDGFVIQRSSDGGGTWGTIATTGADVTSYHDTGVGGGTTYKYRVEAVSGTSASGFAGPAGVTTVPAAPNGLVATADAAGRVTLTWADGAGETLYGVERSTDGVAWSSIGSTGANETTFADTGVSGGVRYYYRVRAGSSMGWGGYTSAASAVTIPDAPGTPVVTVNSATQATVNWGAVNGATSYVVERSGDGVSWFTLTTTATTSVADMTLSPGTRYYYRVRAVGASGTSDASAAGSGVTRPGSPGAAVATADSASKITVTWSAVAGVDQYEIERSADGATGWVLVGTDALDSTFIDTGLAAQTPYYYRVRAVNGAGASGYSPVASATTQAVASGVTTPGGLTAIAVGADRVVVRWEDKSNNEDGFVVERSEDGGRTWVTVATTDPGVKEFEDSGLVAGAVYQYRVEAYSGEVVSGEAGPVSVRMLPGVPGGLSVGVEEGVGFDLTWDAAEGAMAYRVERSLDGVSGWVTIAQLGGDATEYVDGSVAAGSRVYYRVRGVNEAGVSGATDVVSAVTVPDAPDVVSVVAVSASKLQVNWTPVGGASGYRVERWSDDFGDWVLVGVTGGDATSFVDEGLAANTDYTYQVRAVNDAGASDAGMAADGVTLKTAPVGPSALSVQVVSNRTVALTWTDGSDCESGFRVEYSIDGRTWKLAGTVPADTDGVQVTGLVAGKVYRFRVAAYNEMGFSGVSNVASGKTLGKAIRQRRALVAREDLPALVLNIANVKSAYSGLSKDLAPDAPLDLTGVVYSLTGVQLTWADASDSELGFKVEYSLNGRTWVNAGYVAADQTGCRVIGLQKGKQYQFRVSAYNLAGFSGRSGTVKVAVPKVRPQGGFVMPSMEGDQDSVLNVAKVRDVMPGLPGNVRVA